MFCYDTLPSSPFPPNTMITIKTTLAAALLAVGLHAQLAAAPAKDEGQTADPEHSRLVAARKAAKRLRSEVVLGGDPLAAKKEKRAVPTYAELAKTEDGRSFAERVFKKARPGYHPITSGSVTEVLKAPEPDAEQP